MKPRQYKKGIDTIERAKANMDKKELLAVCRFMIDKYNWREKDQDLDDLYKAKDYIDLAIYAIQNK